MLCYFLEKRYFRKFIGNIDRKGQKFFTQNLKPFSIENLNGIFYENKNERICQNISSVFCYLCSPASY